MKSYWHYHCDFGHQWFIIRDFDAEENPEDAVCPFGHEAVTLAKQPIVYPVEIRLTPATQIADPRVKKQIILTKHCYITAIDLETGKECRAFHPVLWEIAKDKIAKYFSMTFIEICADINNIN